MYLFSDFGDLPVMIVGGDVAAQVEIFGAAPDFGATGEAIIGGDGGSGHTPTKGTKENVPCSRRGFCDTLTGKGGRVVVRCCALLCVVVHVCACLACLACVLLKKIIYLCCCPCFINTGVCTCYTAFQTSNGVGDAGPRGKTHGLVFHCLFVPFY